MAKEGLPPPDHVMSMCLLQACASAGDLQEGKKLHMQIQQSNLESHAMVSNSLINMYAKCGAVEEGRAVFDRMHVKNVGTWTAMITGYVQQGSCAEALEVYADITFVFLLKACDSVGALRTGKGIHTQIQERGFESNMIIGNSLVDMYAKCGRLQDARQVLDSLPARDVVTWTTLLKGYADHSHGQMAMLCFEEMQQQGVMPNAATFTCLLVACSHEALVKEGQRYFKAIRDEYGIVPIVDHYNCMVDLLGRSGHLDEAENILHTLPCEADAVGWRSLLCACRMHGDIDRAKRCFDCLVTLEPQGASAYALMASIYINAGNLDDANRVEDMRKEAGAWKKPARAYIEVQSKVQEFTVGEGTGNVSSRLKNINSRLQHEGGHEPQTDLVLIAMPEVRKQDALCGHAEKLAVACGPLNTPDGTPLLIPKNLRMCNDCHSSTKIMSRLEKREIVVKDAHRVHRFENGLCSCGYRL